MKIYQKLAVATAGVAVLASVGTAPAAAAQFILSGRFGSSFGGPVDNGSFDGTYSYSGPPVGTFRSFGLDSFNVNLRNAAGQTVANLNSTSSDANGGIIGNSDSDNLIFFSGGNELQLNFPSGFAGTGTVIPFDPNADFPSIAQIPGGNPNMPQLQGGNADVVSGRSEAVPEPEEIVGTVVAGYFFWQMHRKIARSQKVQD